MSTESILRIENLRFSFMTYAGEVQAVRGISLEVKAGEVLGLVGESGCGKSVACKSILRLNPEDNGVYLPGSRILFEGKDVLTMSERELLRLRANDIRMVFQDPMTSLNPTIKVGKQIAEGILNAFPKMKRREAKELAIETLRDTGIPNAEKRYEQYPHQFSGGMRQRAMIALALAVKPKLLICDEPTTALDVTLQAQILDMLRSLQAKYQTAIIFITHDLGVVANIADHIAVMYAGKIMEYGNGQDIFYDPKHPYTWGVLQSVPPIDADTSVPLVPISGSPPDLFKPPIGCPFTARCPHAMEVCRQHYPSPQQASERHIVTCWLYHAHAPHVINPITNEEAVL